MTSLLKGHEGYIVTHTRKEIMQKFNVNYNCVNYFCVKNGLKPIADWLSMKIRDMNLPCKRHNCKEAKLSTHSCKRTGEAQDMIRHLAKTFTMASIARVFGYTRENIRQICADNEE